MITTVKTGNERHEIYLNDEFSGWMFIPSKIDESDFSVIGNIHENPELLEQSK